MPRITVPLTLKRAAQAVGGTEQLATSLKVTPGKLQLWMKGAAGVPPEVFLKAVDVITENDAPDKLPT